MKSSRQYWTEVFVYVSLGGVLALYLITTFDLLGSGLRWNDHHVEFDKQPLIDAHKRSQDQLSLVIRLQKALESAQEKERPRLLKQIKEAEKKLAELDAEYNQLDKELMDEYIQQIKDKR